MPGGKRIEGSSESVDQSPAGPAVGARTVFVSYASPDAEVGKQICQFLESLGVSCWMAPRDVRPGAVYADAIVRAITEANALVLVLSAAAIASEHVSREVERAGSKHKRIVTFRVDVAALSAELEYFLSRSQWIDVVSLGIPVALVKLAEAVGRGSADVTYPAAPRMSAIHVSGRGRFIAAAAVVIGIGLAVALGLYFRSSKQTTTQAPTIAAYGVPKTAVSPIPDKSIAVLPFADMSEKKDQEYFADGMAEEILNVLAKLPNLRVIGRTSSFQFKGRNEDLREVGSKLGARYVLEGSVRQAGGTVRLTAQLIDSRDGSHVWSETYDRAPTDVLKMQADVAATIARTLELSIGADPIGHVKEIKNIDDYNSFLRALSALNRYDEVGVAEAEVGFSAVLARDPSFVRAREELAFTHFVQGAWGFNDAKAAFGLVEQEAAALLTANPRSGFARALLGSIALFDLDWPEADRQLTMALAADPNEIMALFSSGDLAAAFGHWNEAAKFYNMALSFDPLNSNTWNELGFMLFRAGRIAEGEAAVRRCLSITPTFASARMDLGLILLAEGRSADALAEMEQDSDVGFRMMGRALGLNPARKTDSDAALAELTASDASRHAFRIAEVYGYRGGGDEAFRWLDRAYTQQDVELQYIKGNLLLRPLLGDPRFKAFLEKMHLPE